jgi:hypothetical protein
MSVYRFLWVCMTCIGRPFILDSGGGPTARFNSGPGPKDSGPRPNFFLDLSMVNRRLHDDLRKIYLHMTAPRFDLRRRPASIVDPVTRSWWPTSVAHELEKSDSYCANDSDS